MPRSNTSLKRTPFRRVKQQNAQGETVIAGVLWPAGWIPEEPLPGFRRNRDDCFRWRVEDFLHAAGWKFWHIGDPRRNPAGFPDLLCVRERVMWLELKVRDKEGRPNGMSPVQQAFAASLIHAGGEFHCITWPDDWDRVVEVLKR